MVSISSTMELPVDKSLPEQSFSPTPDGWRALLADKTSDAARHYPLPAYSEFMPPPRLGITPLGEVDSRFFSPNDPYGWPITEIEEEYDLKPGLEQIARQVLDELFRLGQGLPAHHLAGHQGQNLRDNPYWPPELATRAGHLANERYVILLPLALSRTQDDKGRLRWTLFGSSEQGPERAFWKGFFSAPGVELPEDQAISFFVHLINGAYGESIPNSQDLLSAGFRILPTDSGEALPSWVQRFLIEDSASFTDIHYLLTFRPFAKLPAPVKERYLDGTLALLPFPGSLAFWGMPTYQHLQQQLPLAMQIPLLQLITRHSGKASIRVPQSGWLYEPHPTVDPAEVQQELLLHHYARTNRWDKDTRDSDEGTLNPRLEKVARVLFSTDLDVMGLYDKPMARNCQLWTRQFDLLLDGPNATWQELRAAEAELIAGGLSGYRFQFPPMQVGHYAVYWQRPLAAYRSPQTGAIEVLDGAPLGYLTAYTADAPDVQHPITLWPRLLQRPAYLSALRDFSPPHEHFAHQTALDIVSLLDQWESSGRQPLPRSLARQLLRIPKRESLEQWLATLPSCANDPAAGQAMQATLEALLEPTAQPINLPPNLTFSHTASRSFEEAYWNDIAFLSRGEYRNKDNADCVQDTATLELLTHRQRDLEALGDALLARHRQAIVDAGMQGKAVCGELRFKWQTDFDFTQFGGWQADQVGNGYERDLLVVIPGKNRDEAVVMADHYDTAYMEDIYGDKKARLAAPGADDNASATATLLQAAPIFLQLAREGKLERDIWLLHLTGEEFPADCMGARHFCQALVEKALGLGLGNGQSIDLSTVQVAGVLLMDMIAHNRDSDSDIFQISPGHSAASLALARQAHWANWAWNMNSKEWNARPERSNLPRGRRSADGTTLPAPAHFLTLDGEVRTQDDPASSLYNTDGQVFSDSGVPVVLFMENYDIHRHGYHDTQDTMANIDLDYGAALAAIAIETVARLAALSESGRT
jgi:Peptidase family M28